jgi:hypothetical protein
MAATVKSHTAANATRTFIALTLNVSFDIHLHFGLWPIADIQPLSLSAAKSHRGAK